MLNATNTYSIIRYFLTFSIIKSITIKRLFIAGSSGVVEKYFMEYLTSVSPETKVLGTYWKTPIKSRNKMFKFQKLNLCDKYGLRDLLQRFQPTHILHLMSMSSGGKSWIEPAESFINNTNIFLNLVESLRILKINARVLSIGSSEEYGGLHDIMPLNEKTSELKVCSPYSIARISQEMMAKLYCRDYGIKITMTRSFNHIGPRQATTFVIPSIIKQLILISRRECKQLSIGNIDITRDFLDVRDVVKAYYKLLKYGRNGEIYNVCSGIGRQLREIINYAYASKNLNISPKIVLDKKKVTSKRHTNYYWR